MNDIIETDVFEGSPIHRLMVDGVHYWVASDACVIAGLKNVSQAVNGGANCDGLDDDEKLLYSLYMSGCTITRDSGVENE